MRCFPHVLLIHVLPTEELKVDLAEPEFEGLWDQHKPYKVPKDTESTLKLPGATTMDRVILRYYFLSQLFPI